MPRSWTLTFANCFEMPTVAAFDEQERRRAPPRGAGDGSSRLISVRVAASNVISCSSRSRSTVGIGEARIVAAVLAREPRVPLPRHVRLDRVELPEESGGVEPVLSEVVEEVLVRLLDVDRRRRSCAPPPGSACDSDGVERAPRRANSVRLERPAVLREPAVRTRRPARLAEERGGLRRIEGRRAATAGS